MMVFLVALSGCKRLENKALKYNNSKGYKKMMVFLVALSGCKRLGK